MKIFAALLLLMLGLSRCSEEDLRMPCSTQATVRDLTGLDGCGFVFELEDGTRLEPVREYRLYCGTPPLPKEVTEDPLYNFNFVDGKKVLIAYELKPSGSYCMAGLPAKITCLSEIPEANTQVPSGNR
jgi:hypothetical protein